MSEKIELVNGTRHNITVGADKHVIPPSLDVGELRAEAQFEDIGTLRTNKGLVHVRQVEFNKLDQDSADRLNDYITKQRRSLGRAAHKLIVASPFAVFGARLSGFNTDPHISPVSLGWPAKLQRDENGHIVTAMRIGTLPPAPSGHRPSLDPETIAHRRRRDLFDDDASPFPITSLSPDQLTLGQHTLDSNGVLEPTYPYETIHVAQPGDVEVAYEKVGSFPANSYISADLANVAHSRAALALNLATNSPFGYVEASRVMMPDTDRDPETRQKTGEIGSLAVYGPKTLRRYAELF